MLPLITLLTITLLTITSCGIDSVIDERKGSLGTGSEHMVGCSRVGNAIAVHRLYNSMVVNMRVPALRRIHLLHTGFSRRHDGTGSFIMLLKRRDVARWLDKIASGCWVDCGLLVLPNCFVHILVGQRRLRQKQALPTTYQLSKPSISAWIGHG